MLFESPDVLAPMRSLKKQYSDGPPPGSDASKRNLANNAQSQQNLEFSTLNPEEAWETGSVESQNTEEAGQQISNSQPDDWPSDSEHTLASESAIAKAVVTVTNDGYDEHNLESPQQNSGARINQKRAEDYPERNATDANTQRKPKGQTLGKEENIVSGIFPKTSTKRTLSKTAKSKANTANKSCTSGRKRTSIQTTDLSKWPSSAKGNEDIEQMADAASIASQRSYLSSSEEQSAMGKQQGSHSRKDRESQTQQWRNQKTESKRRKTGQSVRAKDANKKIDDRSNSSASKNEESQAASSCEEAVHTAIGQIKNKVNKEAAQQSKKQIRLGKKAVTIFLENNRII